MSIELVTTEKKDHSEIQKYSDTIQKNDSKITKGYWSTGRLVIGILSILLFVFVSFQSCAVGLGNTIMENEAVSGTQGFVMAIAFLIAGIIGISTRNALSSKGMITATVFYWIGALFTLGSGDTYEDLPIWGFVAFCFGVVFLIAAKRTSDMTKNNH